jgi:hypothetical protein
MTYDGEEKRHLSRGDEKVGASDDKPVGVYRDTKQKVYRSTDGLHSREPER